MFASEQIGWCRVHSQSQPLVQSPPLPHSPTLSVLSSYLHFFHNLPFVFFFPSSWLRKSLLKSNQSLTSLFPPVCPSLYLSMWWWNAIPSVDLFATFIHCAFIPLSFSFYHLIQSHVIKWCLSLCCWPVWFWAPQYPSIQNYSAMCSTLPSINHHHINIVLEY